MSAAETLLLHSVSGDCRQPYHDLTEATALPLQQAWRNRSQHCWGHGAGKQICICEAQLQQQWGAQKGEAAHVLCRQGTF